LNSLLEAESAPSLASGVRLQHWREDRTVSADVGRPGAQLPDEQVETAVALPDGQVGSAVALPDVQVGVNSGQVSDEQVVKAVALPGVQVVATAG